MSAIGSSHASTAAQIVVRATGEIDVAELGGVPKASWTPIESSVTLAASMPVRAVKAPGLNFVPTAHPRPCNWRRSR